MARVKVIGLLALVSAAGAGAGVRIEPGEISLPGPGASQHVLAAVSGAQDIEADGGAGCVWSGGPSTVVNVSNAVITAVGAGRARVVVRCGGLTAEASVTVGSSAAALEASFGRDIVSILTQKGCNSSSCHGSPAGQNGFKLSLYASDPAADHKMIVEGHGGRRVNRTDPESSLLLKKPLFAVPHGGGHLLTKQSDEYVTVLKWLSQGAVFNAGGPRMTRLELFPRERILVGAGVKQPLVAIGRLSDGTTRDMTGEVRFSVADEAVVSGVAGGAVTARSRGLTVVTARAMGQTATAQFIVIDRAADASYTAVAPANLIDEAIFAKLRQVNIAPFPVSDDRTFARRVYLDAVGILPLPAQVEAFAADARPDKRARLIDELLSSDNYASHWLVKFEDWFRNSQYYSQGRTNASYKRWLRELISEDRPYDAAVREMLTATGDTTVRPAGNFWHPSIDFMLKTFDVAKATPTVTRLFLGQRIECAECHNHPLENLTQDDYYGMAAFLGQVRVKHGYGQYRRVWFDAREGEVLHPVTKKPVQPRWLDGGVPAIGEGQTRRQVLADWITRTQKMQFARATVNKIWAEYFTTGIVDPPDDFRSTNMATHPELLDKLAGYFIEEGFRFRALHKLILNSKTYQLASATPGRPGGTDPLERVLFARYEPRKLPAEVLFDSLLQVAGATHKFTDYPPGTTSKDLVATNGPPNFLSTFGLTRRDVIEQRSAEPSLAQALHMMNSDGIREKVEQKDNILAALLESTIDDSRVVDALYLRAYSRTPNAAQRQRIETYLAAERAAGRPRRRGFENLLWVILNSREFQLNR
ncbi:MAG: DUF1553 domain-containing protein [Acidobacteria bacterium]|nr:DUF1553 domain-containing protein [Acidobacteriota bacterium]